MKTTLTIAGSDPSGGAGIQADLRVFAELGVYGLSVVTAVTAQNSEGVIRIDSVAPRTIAAQIDAVVRDFGADACKIGMLYSRQAVEQVSERIDRRELKNVVLDPVMSAKDGRRLLLHSAVKRLRRQLIRKCALVTPNLSEAGELTGTDVADLHSAADAARAIHDCGAQYVLVKGGHLGGEPVDVLYDGKSVTEFPGKRVEDRNMHGTGCMLSAAIAARLALGDTVPDAIRFGKDYVESAIKNSIRIGKGKLWYFAGTTIGGDTR